MATTQRTHDSNTAMSGKVLFVVGTVTLFVLSEFRPLVAVAVYGLAAGGSLAVLNWSGASLDTDFGGGSPADTTLDIVGMAAAVVFPALVAADGLGYSVWSESTTGIAYCVAGIFAVYGIMSVVEWVRGWKQ